MKKTYFALAVSAVLSGACATSTPPGPSVTAALNPASGSKVNGTVTFTQIGTDRVRVSGNVAGHTPGQKGFHIHENGDCSAADAMSAGGHFNPMKAKHAASPTSGHAGDMGNLTFDGSGRATVSMTLDGLSVSTNASNGIIGRAVVVHMQPDDLTTDPTGNAGGRAACGVIR